MIALNKIIENKQWFEKKYALMGKSFNLEKIINLEKKFIQIDTQSKNLRATCNKLCAETAEIAAQKQPQKSTKNLSEKIEITQIRNNPLLSQHITKIKILDKKIRKLEKKSNLAMNKINHYLSKLPNAATQSNTLNLIIPSKENSSFNKLTFLELIDNIAAANVSVLNLKKVLKSQKNMVLQADDLPFSFVHFSKKSLEVLIYTKENALEILSKIEEILKNNAKYFIDKSVKHLNKFSSREYLAILSNHKRITVEFWDEFVSREIGLKFYSPVFDMTKFVNLIKISCE